MNSAISENFLKMMSFMFLLAEPVFFYKNPHI